VDPAESTQREGWNPSDDGSAITLLRLARAVLLVVAALIAADLVLDARGGADAGHVVVEGAAALLALGCAALLGLRLRRSVAALASQLDRAREDAARYRREAGDLLAGLGAAIDAQFEAWGLTEAEREVGLLLLKGLSLKDVARIRGTSERTAREQAQAVYRKGELAGRADLSAFFLEDLLLPRRSGGDGNG